MREHKRAHQSELLVIVRDARGVQEEKPLRVRAKFDDEEKMTVRCVDFFVFACVSLLYFLLRLRAWFVSVDVDQKENARI